MLDNNVLLVAVALLLVLLNGFFVAAEFSLVKLRQTRVKAVARAAGWRGRPLVKVHGDLDAYLSACQLGITLASLGLGWIGEPAFAALIEAPLAAIGIVSPQATHVIAFVLAFTVISYLHIVVGELAPKSMAIRRSESVGLWTAAPLYGFYWAMYPAIWALNRSANWLLRKTRLDAVHSHESQYSVPELKLILRSSRADERTSADDWRVLAFALDFRDLTVSDLMRPFAEVVALSGADPLQKNLDRVSEHRFSRYPYLDRRGRVSGVIHLKDLFFALRTGNAALDLASLARPVQHVVPDLPAADLLRRFRQGAPHFAVVELEQGRPLGFVTLDNLLGALVGEIRDEFRRAQNDWTRLDDGSLLGKGSLPLFSLERALGLDIQSTQADTLAGLVMEQLGDLPKQGQRVEFERFVVEVKAMRGPRLTQVRVYPRREGEAPPA